MHPRIPLAFLAARAHCWLMVNLSSTRTPRSHSTELLSRRSTPSLYWCMGLFLPSCRTLHLPLLNLIRFLSAQLSSLSRSRWMAAQPAGVSTTPPSFVSSTNLLRVHSNSSSRSLMKKLNKTRLSTDPWGIPLVTSLQLDSAPLMTTLWVLPFSQFSVNYFMSRIERRRRDWLWKGEKNYWKVSVAQAEGRLRQVRAQSTPSLPVRQMQSEDVKHFSLENGQDDKGHCLLISVDLWQGNDLHLNRFPSHS